MELLRERRCVVNVALTSLGGRRLRNALNEQGWCTTTLKVNMATNITSILSSLRGSDDCQYSYQMTRPLEN